MSVGQSSVVQSINSFFLRSGLTAQDQLDCYTFVQKLYPNKSISPATCQGYCSLTVFVGDDTVIQFRPSNYRLDLRITSAARDVYGRFAPKTEYIATLPASDLLVYRMEKIGGIPFKDLLYRGAISGRSMSVRVRLCRDFAVFLSKSWHRSSTEHLPLGTVGRSIRARLISLTEDLPVRFRASARHVLVGLHRIEALPWVLTHGDIVAANIMVDPSFGVLTGLVDWAEAENLPFGICLYGVEEILGEITPTGFQYRPDAEYLRAIFWAELKRSIPALGVSHIFEAVKLARDLGVLLWHGIAFDDGAIDRVVQEGRDVDEIHKLEAFLTLGDCSRLEESKLEGGCPKL
ncbi:hypothetical protein ONS95_009348 [Cadophora gregata]|uniref:uncharacterized protein n=1 Tax=Cadophora gregata TaxID=51156 RepID=UPI0026DB7628|nr:uncharacterized protein ONS95_009348 [Cadophora gregata]KAK0124386.1 hypothetical protein ONS95_009348 [Cadophora gregata]KAK0129765.1 hypothetical protein ONS96_000320 [Cadophora gregata f. sp. sojae]